MYERWPAATSLRSASRVVVDSSGELSASPGGAAGGAAARAAAALHRTMANNTAQRLLQRIWISSRDASKPSGLVPRDTLWQT